MAGALDTLYDKAERLENQIAECEDGIEIARSEIEEMAEEMKSLNREIAQRKAIIQRLTAKANEAARELRKVEAQISRLED